MPMPRKINLGINIDHIATFRNARLGNDPSLLEMAFEAQEGGADSITIHLREDRRHIVDTDLPDLKKHLKIPINLEMALTKEMIDIAIRIRPYSVCIVPEKREELTTEGGLDAVTIHKKLSEGIAKLQMAGIEVFPFVNADFNQIKSCKEAGANGVEVHTGDYALAFGISKERHAQLALLQKAAEYTKDMGLYFHAGHGLNYTNIKKVVGLENLREVNIGHAIISRALKVGLKNAVQEMREELL